MKRAARISLCVLLGAFMAGVGCSSSPATCTSSADCGSGQGCYFPIGKCPSQGQCIDGPRDDCLAVKELCGCDGSHVLTGCNFPEGYAEGPTDGTPVSTTGESCTKLLEERDASLE